MENYKIIVRLRPVGLDVNKKCLFSTNKSPPLGEIIIKIFNLLLLVLTNSKVRQRQILTTMSQCHHVILPSQKKVLVRRCGLSKSLEIYSQIIAIQCLEC